MFGFGQEQEEEGDEAVEEEYFEAEGVAEPCGREELEEVADDGRGDGDVGHEAVVDAALGEEAEGVEAQQGAVGEAGDIEDDGDEGVAVEWPEGHDDEQVEQGEGDVDNPSDCYGSEGGVKGECGGSVGDITAVFCICHFHSTFAPTHSPFTPLLLAEAEEVVAEGGGEGCEGAVGGGIARGDDAEDEADGREAVEGEGYGREDFVAHHTAVGARGQLEARLRGVGNEGRAEAEEDDVDHDEEQAGGHDVLLRVAEGLAGEVLLHHVLVEARHGDGDEHAGEHLLEPELGGHGVGVEHLGVALLGGGAQEFRQAHVEVAEDGHHGGHGGEDEECGLEGVGPDDGLDAAGEGVEQDDGYEDHRRYPEGYAPGGEDELVEHEDHQVHAKRGAEEARDDEKEGSGALAAQAEALGEVGVDGGEVELVVQRQKDQGDGGVAEDITEDHRHVEPLVGQHVAWDGHEGDAGERGTDHAVGHHGPGRLAAGAEEGLVTLGAASPGEPHNEEKQQRVGCKTQ